MNIHSILNPTQHDAVTAPPGNMLVLAGAGSGKTRVLVHRIAWLMQECQVSPYAILAVTFTNKAAAEMRSRVESMLAIPARHMWIGTFHGLAHRLLRMHWQAAKLPEAFQILDSEDQYRLVRRIIRSLGIDEERFQPKQVQWYINNKKDDGKRPQHINTLHHPAEKTLVRVYEAYEETCQKNGLVDFAELLLRAHELWLNNPDILKHYQQRFLHVLVDEFQDTNTIQYAWLRLLMHKDNHMMIVGDDDQSIYGWRGAQIENLQKFQKDFSNTQTIRLEQNYRSTGNILKAANALIAHNRGRLGKNLWTKDSAGDLINLYEAYNDRDEARYIISHILKQTQGGYQHSDCAILYRSNAQSRVLEEALIQMSLPYRIYGGLRFFERAEIKDALAYLRLIENQDNDPSFERIVNLPTRGIGNTTLDMIRAIAKEQNLSLWNAVAQCQQESALSERAINALKNFIDLIQTVKEEIKTLPLHEQIEHMFHRTNLLAHYQKEKGEQGRARVENLEELISAAREFEMDKQETLSPLSSFLAHAALESGENQAEFGENCVQLMTLHSAKGLEFSIVFLAGLEEGLFPHKMAIEESPERIEEERRLCYVGMTRAKKSLYLTCAQTRRLHGYETIQRPSRFLKEIPKDCLHEVRIKVQVSRPETISAKNNSRRRLPQENNAHDSGLRLGQTVKHAKFGEGVILGIDGTGERAHIEIKFRQHGTKRLMAQYAKLESIN